MIKDKQHFEQFINVLPELNKDEVYFISLSARNKYLTKDERTVYDLGRTEMFGRELVYEKTMEKFTHVLTKLNSLLSVRRTNNGSTIPDKCLVTYMNLNPSHTVKTLGSFISNMTKELFEYNHNLVNGNSTDLNLKRFQNCRSILNTEFQRNVSRKNFIDIDFDCLDEDVLNSAKVVLDKNNCKYFIIKTQGGFHISIKRETMKFNYVNDIIHYCNNIINLNKLSGVVENNKNLMVPTPGTLQAGKLVEFIYCNY